MKILKNIKDSKGTTGAGIAVLAVAILKGFGVDLEQFGLDFESLTMAISAIILLFAKDPNKKESNQ